MDGDRMPLTPGGSKKSEVRILHTMLDGTKLDDVSGVRVPLTGDTARAYDVVYAVTMRTGGDECTMAVKKRGI
ncbi:MAG: hypothetical protein LUH07_07175 [Lachnospiraceae bacterium]|nr:hypothetical protein [Lachnospiraceae bacterium]